MKVMGGFGKVSVLQARLQCPQQDPEQTRAVTIHHRLHAHVPQDPSDAVERRDGLLVRPYRLHRLNRHHH